ncbi:hypothetical protein HYU18_02265 [Candidatus Woesearchaeota archaeon]|nr:hypothetical protein [Candidatus Woesearchaeota archaeon]
MGNIYFSAPTGIASTSVAPEQPVLATISGAGSPVITPTYAGQVPVGSSILVQLGNSAKIANVISESFITATRDRAKQLREELEGHYAAIAPLWKNRTLVFVQYLEREHKIGKSFQVAAGRLREGEYTPQDISQLIGTFVNNSAKKTIPGASEAEMREKIRAFVTRGEYDGRMLEFLNSLDGKFGLLPAYLDRANELQGLSSPETTLNELEAAVERHKTGSQAPVRAHFLDDQDLESRLEDMLGKRWGSHYILEAAKIEEGEDAHALVVPFAYKPNSAVNKSTHQFLPVERLMRIITLFDRIILDAIDAYVQQAPELKGLLEQAFIKQGFSELNLAILRKAVFGPEHQPSAALYPDYRLDIKDPALKVAIINEFQSRRQDITGAALPKFGLTEEQFDFEAVVNVQSQAMELLPVPIYKMAAISSQFKDPRQAVRQSSKYSAQARTLLFAFQAYDRQLQRDFGITFGNRLLTPTQETLENAATLFGERNGLGFLKTGAQILVTASP